MSSDIASRVQRVAATTGFSSTDIVDAVAALNARDALLPEPWTDETIVRALPTIVAMAELGAISVRAVAAGVRATTALRPDEEPTT